MKAKESYFFQISERGENRVIPEEPQFFSEVNTKDYKKVNVPFRFKNYLTGQIQCIFLTRGS